MTVEEQLLAALRECAEKDARIAELEKYGNLQFEEVHAALDRAEAAEAKLRATEQERDHTWTQRNADLFAERNALQAKLRAVSDALDKHGHDQWVHASVVGLFARIRAIAEG